MSSTATGGVTTRWCGPTHGVNCTGSCSWKIYVRDGIITWEAQQTDYPSPAIDPPW
jgi:nitrate reductase alpha subunit